MRFQCEAARQLQLLAGVDAVMQSTSVWLYSVSADKAGSFDKAEVLEDVISRRVHVCFVGVLAGARAVRVSEILTPIRKFGLFVHTNTVLLSREP